jgi:hypothetical protein
MSRQQPWFVRDRATALASLLLTSRKDVDVRQLTDDESGVDLLAEVLKGGAKAGRFFGVQVAGRLDLPDGPTVDPDPRSPRPKRVAEFTMPLCAFLFDVRSNQGFYRWVVEPIIEHGDPKLERLTDKKWNKLDEAAVDGMVDHVSAWYDALADRLRAS